MGCRKKINAEAIARLGTCLDSVIAMECEVSVSAVTQQRRQRGIPAFRRRADYRRWALAENEMLGSVPDVVAAAILSRSRKDVRGKRLRIAKAACAVPTQTELIRGAMKRLNTLPA